MSLLRTSILYETSQDIRICRGCLACEVLKGEMDIPLGSLIQLVLMNDDEVLTSRTLWSDPLLELARSACIMDLNIKQILLALRKEAIKRGIQTNQGEGK